MKKTLFAAVAVIALAITACTPKPKVDLITIKDAAFSFPAELFIRPDSAPATDYSPSGVAKGACNAFLYKTDGHVILFDTGAGSNDSQLWPELEKVGVAPEDISDIFITHAHYDHIGGLVLDSLASFPNAQLWISEKEAPDYDGPINAAYKGRIHRFSFSDKLPYGIKSFDGIGHTEGHTVYQVGNYLIIGDLIHGAEFQFQDPYLCAKFDSFPEASVEKRIYFLNYALDHKLKVAGMHLPDGIIEDISTVWNKR